MVFTITKCENVENKGSCWKQYALSFMVSLPYITHGIEANNLTITSHSGHFLARFNDVPLSTTMLIISAGISAPLLSLIIDRLGRKFGVYLIIMLQGICCIPLLLPPNRIAYIMTHFLAGLSSAGLFTVIPVYIREIAPASSRASLVSLIIIMTPLGYLTRLVMDDESMMYLMAAMVMLEFVTVFLMIESPSYLVKVGKFDRAKTNIAKLKCLQETDNYVIMELKRLKEESDRTKPWKYVDLFKNKIWRDASKIGLVLFTITTLSGSSMFLDQAKALAQLKTSIDPEQMLVPLGLLAGGASSVVLVRFVDRKYLLTVSYSLIALSMGVLAVDTLPDLTVKTLRWLPVVSLIVVVFAYGMAWGLPTVIMVEILNLEIRSTVLALVYAYSQIIRMAHVHTLKYFEDLMGTHTLFYVFAGVNLVGAVYSIMALPHIKDKSVKQIEKQLKRVPVIDRI
ncbi:solute carrier family 2, facilitated glucose transporter member 2 [Pieris rapae]|uniref:solute carrier family 2, facilitated glucose transporter member 2 n=1 Tax=Pieris rapae TaxID=64459 RepID=UPI001E27E971|nr:solute carrier family 2, facilitated glucose transporter member 2 [Pieris rapae]